MTTQAHVYLAEWRAKRGLTQQALADLTGVEQKTISRIETGQQKTLRLALLTELAEALRVEPWQVLKGPP